jgi:hypothetical protein
MAISKRFAPRKAVGNLFRTTVFRCGEVLGRKRFLTPCAALVLAWLAAVSLVIPARAQQSRQRPAWTVDHRYAPVWWQTAICLPDDWQKTLVGKEGTLLYDHPGKRKVRVRL